MTVAGGPEVPAPVAPGAAEKRVALLLSDVTFATQLAQQLVGAGCSVRVATSADQVADVVAGWRPETAVADLGMPSLPIEMLLDGAGPPRGMILVREGADPAERTEWLQRGAVDFVPSPLGAPEVVARVLLVLRRGAPTTNGDRRGWSLVAGPVHVDERSGRVEVDGRVRTLSPMEFKLLRHLASDPGTVHSRRALLRDVWGYTTGGDSTVTVHIRKLREKIERDPEHPVLIRTRHGLGYYFVATAEVG